MTARRTTLRELDDGFDVASWAGISPDERFAEAWRRLKALLGGPHGVGHSLDTVARLGARC